MAGHVDQGMGSVHVAAHALHMQIPAMALTKCLSVVTRNSADPVRTGGSLVNPVDGD